VTIIFSEQSHEIFQLFIKTQVTANSYQFTGKPLPIAKFQEELSDFLELVPTDKILEIALDYVANDTEVKDFIAYIQSEEFPKIHKIVEDLKEYKDVSAFMWMFLSLNLTEKLFVPFQLVSELLFSSVSNSSLIKELTFMNSSVKFITSLKNNHSNQQIPHARVLVFMDSLMMWWL